jgi:hypothetical protein
MHGLYLAWWVQEKHLPMAAVATILAAGDLAVTGFEFPAGWLADRFGHRVSLVAGSLLQVAGMVLCWLGRGVPGLLAASLFVALGDAFRSGADQALLYRSCLALERERDFQTIEARARAIQLAGMVGLILAGGAIVETWGYAVGWFVETAVCATGLTIACAMVEPARRGDDPASRARVTWRESATVRLRGQSAGGIRTLIALILPASLLGSAASAASFLAQTAGGPSPARLTMLVAIITLAEAAGSTCAARLGAAGVRVQIALASLGAAAIAAALILPAASLPTVVALSFLLGMAHPLRAAAIQRLAADGERARTASIAIACDRAFMTIALIGIGMLPRRR